MEDPWQFLHRTDTGFRWLSGGPCWDLRGLDFGQSSSDLIARTLRVDAFAIFSASPALQACSCPLCLSAPGKPVGPLNLFPPSSICLRQRYHICIRGAPTDGKAANIRAVSTPPSFYQIIRKSLSSILHIGFSKSPTLRNRRR